MIEPTVLLASGAGVGLISFALGFGVAHLTHRKSSVKENPKPICSCEHGIGSHRNKSDSCNEGNYDCYGEWRQCRCLHYDGPEVVPTFHSPDLRLP